MLISQKIAGESSAGTTLFVAASIIVAQLMMIFVSARTGVLADKRGGKCHEPKIIQQIGFENLYLSLQ